MKEKCKLRNVHLGERAGITMLEVEGGVIETTQDDPGDDGVVANLM